MDIAQKTEKLEALIRHIEEVRRNCQLLGFKLISEGKFELGKRLIANSYCHDNSKFYSLEWQHLTKSDEDDDMLDVVIKVHNTSNLHHPEYWDGIENMPEVYIAEMLCDWKARSSELGTNLKEWIDTKALTRWKISKRHKVYKSMSYYLSLLVEKTL